MIISNGLWLIDKPQSKFHSILNGIQEIFPLIWMGMVIH